MEQALKNAILQFEPRILPRTLEVELVMEGSALDSHNRIGLRIRGMLWAQPVPLEFLMRSRIDLEEGRIEIEDMTSPRT
jgi:type VI secretion system protein ImpF